MVFRREGDRWLLAHLHHSTPNVDQHRDEYYPKTADGAGERRARVLQGYLSAAPNSTR